MFSPSEALKAFFSPRGIIIFMCAAFYIGMVGSNLVFYSQRYNFHKFEYERTEIYHRQAICQDTAIRAMTEGKNKCDEYALYMISSPWSRALMDVFENISLCSGDTCSRWFSQFLIMISLVTMVLLYLLVNHTSWTIERATEISSSLPILFRNSQGHAKKYT